MKPTAALARDLQPVQKLAKGFTQCSQEAAIYGQCITAKYQEVEKGMCNQEFLAFKDCVQKSVGRKW
ncbi:uncharacterized protein L969DRAFT_89982 [Mixia osmundae IAM 14324]|uniref:IMS import disulfide relay-system CHCH-CHCH-like Cx9C domain-containing protein n=1 Tax=Mixia osmundae (strain CBS 9802 / IAM 14324 / JCM 22182 / KY 12970) TaxID=764103 RepID=G7DUT2_MIXOS|nr:uncharacterized protein L969DRAFT_89982 [Mixia osmundae IAM 14324]KEI37440.1 hypothetical protein L969DRAFT_89982 [Mixia osmundae IAM 14324]GAA94342.1 hypothetical protein E5Q_00993 [Mixia osmundae IAM 14324]